jgi:hypothetical protein
MWSGTAEEPDLPGLLARMNRSPLRIEPIDSDSAAFRFVL